MGIRRKGGGRESIGPTFGRTDGRTYALIESLRRDLKQEGGSQSPTDRRTDGRTHALLESLRRD